MFSFDDNAGIHVEVLAKDLCNRIAEHTFSEIPNQINSLAFLCSEGWINFESTVLEPINYVDLQRKPDETFDVSFVIRPYSQEWKAPFSHAVFVVELYNRLRSHYRIKFPEYDESSLELTFSTRALDSTIEAEMSVHGNRVRKIHDQVTAYLASTFDRPSLAVFFDFSDPIRTTCEQYLLYFAQFLADLGVSADTSLTHQAGQVLFTVTPTDRKEALDKIKHALELYLELPSSPISDTNVDSIAVQRLESTVLRLRSDLKLAAAELQAKDATIRAQNLMISMLNGEVLVIL